MVNKDNKLIINIHETAMIDAAALQYDAFERESEQKELNKQGICPHCYQPKKDCTGYKCWIK